MTTANKITIVRILLIPFFIVEILYYFRNGHEVHRLVGLAAFGVAAVLDGVDGYIARHYNQKSELGAILDPLADKLLLVSGIVLLGFIDQPHLKMLPLWVVATILSRDVLMAIGALVIHIACGKVTVRPRVVGKVATVLQMIVLLWTFLKWPVNWLEYWTLAAGVFAGFSGLLYVWDGMKQMSASPTSLPKREQ